jgi:hypothetical protein
MNLGSKLKSSRYKKLLGLALGEKSLLAADLSAGPRPQVRRVAELVYPEGVGLQQPLELGKALAEFLKTNDFDSRQAIVGIPVKWLLVKPKEFPAASAASPATLATMLRLQAETEFSSELKDLVFDYAVGPATEATFNVLLLATPRRYIDSAVELCDAAGVTAVAVTPSALALGATVGAKLGRQVLVLTASAAGSELTLQDGTTASAVRHIRPLDKIGPFVSELRRTVSTLPGGAAGRDMIMWDSSGIDVHALGEQLGLPVRGGTLPTLGVDDSPSGSNGDAQKYAAAVALAVTGLSDEGPSVDFLHSRLAPPKERRVPHWVLATAISVVLVIAGSIYAYHYEDVQQTQLDALNAKLNSISGKVKEATGFVSTVSVAQAWHAGDPRYLACLRDLTEAIPDDGLAYATNLTIKEIAPTVSQSTAPGAKVDPDIGKLLCQLDGKTSDTQRALGIPDQLKVNRAFSDVALLGTVVLPRERAVSFSITFKYDPTKAAK